MALQTRRVFRCTQPGRWYFALFIKHGGARYVLPSTLNVQPGGTVLVEAVSGLGLEVFRSRSMLSHAGMAHRMLEG